MRANESTLQLGLISPALCRPEGFRGWVQNHLGDASRACECDSGTDLQLQLARWYGRFGHQLGCKSHAHAASWPPHALIKCEGKDVDNSRKTFLSVAAAAQGMGLAVASVILWQHTIIF